MTETGNFEVASIDKESGEPTDEHAVVEGVKTNLPVLEDVDHPLVPETNHTYILREMEGNVSDVELVSFVMEDEDFFVILEGEAGVGKNMSVRVLAEAANWPMTRVNFGVGTTYSELVGRYAPVENGGVEDKTIERVEAINRTVSRLKDQGVPKEKAVELAYQAIPEDSSFEWKDGILTKAVKNGWIFVADEINAADSAEVMPLNGLTEDRSSRYLTIEEKSEVIKPHPRFRFVATQNPSDYAGVGELNDGFQSRGYTIEYGYLPPEAELAILRDRTDIIENVGEESTKNLIQFANDIRKQEQSGNNYLTKIGIRNCVKVAKLTNMMDLRDATKTVFVDSAYEEDKDAIKEDLRGRQL
jgi:MoxR-like ATPase